MTAKVVRINNRRSGGPTSQPTAPAKEVSKAQRMYLKQALEGYGAGIFAAVMSGGAGVLAWLTELGPVFTFLSTVIGGGLAIVGIVLRHRYQKELEESKREFEREKLQMALEVWREQGGTLRGPYAALQFAENPPEIPVKESA